MEELEDTGIAPAPAAEETESAPVNETEENEGTEEELGQDQADESGDRPKGKTPKWAEKRFAELTRQREEERRERLYWQQQAMDALKPAQPAQPAPVATDAPPKVEDFTDYDDFIRASARFEARQEFKAEQTRLDQARQQQETHRQQQTHQQKVGSIIERGKSIHADFDMVVMNPSVPITDYVIAAATESEVGHEILYHLGQNPAEAQRIAQLSPYGQAKEIGKIEAKMTATPPKTTTKAPPPVVPVGGNAPAGAEPDPAKDPEGWRAWEQARVRALGRRY